MSAAESLPVSEAELLSAEEQIARMRSRAERAGPGPADWSAYKFDVQVLAIALSNTLALHPPHDHHGCPMAPCPTRHRITFDLAQGWHDW